MLLQANVIGDLHSGSAVDSDSTCGGSIPSSPTKNAAAFVLLRFLYHSSGCSAAGSASGSGPEGRGFKSRHSDQKPPTPYTGAGGFFDTEGRGLEQSSAPQSAKSAEIRRFSVRRKVFWTNQQGQAEYCRRARRCILNFDLCIAKKEFGVYAGTGSSIF